MSTWSTDKEGRVNDPRREMVKNAYARFVAEKEGLGVETTNFGTIKPKDSNTTIVRDFSKSVKEGVKNITPSKGVTFVLESTTKNPSIYYTNPITKKISPDPKAKYVYTPAKGDVGGDTIEVNYWKKVPKDPNDPTKGYKVGEYEVNYEGIMSTLGSNLRKL